MQRANHITLGIFSLNTTLEITATKRGYANQIVHANPESIYLNALNRNIDENENIIPNINNAKNSFKDILNEVFLNIFNHNPYIKTANKYL